MTISDQHIRAIVFLAKDCRPTGARQIPEADWFDAIAKERHKSLEAVTLATIRLAANRNVNRAACLNSAGSHWGDTMLVRDYVPNNAPSEERCTWCGQTEDGLLHTRKYANHPFARRTERMDPDANHAAALAARAELAPTSGPTEPVTREDVAAKDPERHELVEAAREQIKEAQ